MNVALNGIKLINGVPTRVTQEFTKTPDGNWLPTDFRTLLDDTSSASQAGASKAPDCDTYQPGPPARTQLTDQEIAELASKYDPSNMTQAQYDAFLDELVEKGVLTRSDTTWLGRSGLQRLDIDLGDFLTGKNCGWSYVVSGSGVCYRPIEEVENDVITWLQSMVDRDNQRSDALGGGSPQRVQAQNTLLNILRRM